MKKLTMIFLSVLFLLAMLVQTGCEKSTASDTEYGVISIEVISPAEYENIPVGDTITVISKLSGFTFEYSRVDFYFGEASTPVGSFNKSQINDLAAEQEKDAEFSFEISTKNLTLDVTDSIDLRVIAYGNDLSSYTFIRPLILTLPTVDDSGIDVNILSPAYNDTLKIGDVIYVAAELAGNRALFKSLQVNLQNDSIFNSSDYEKLNFEYPSFQLPYGDYTLEFELLTVTDEKIKRYRTFTMIEYIPTFTTPLGEVGYALKSIIQTYDNGYLTVASDSLNGTKIVKYDVEGVEKWFKKIPASVGIGESVCEDTEYDKGYVIAGWRNNGLNKDTWVRKIDYDGNLVWNKQYAYNLENADDAATVIKKSIDDGYIIGGYTKNIFGTGPFTIQCPEDTTVYSYETGYDVRLIKIYSNGNEVWGNTVHYTSHRSWWDITGHSYVANDMNLHPEHYIRKMGDQYITDLVAKEDGSYLVTGWNNARLYDSGPNGLKKDVFYAELDCFGGFKTTTTWSTMDAYDFEHISTEDSFIEWGHPSSRIGFTLIQSNHLGDYSEDEIGRGIVESQDGGYSGEVVMAGLTYQIDDGPVKSKLNDAWVMEYEFNIDEDGIIWEYSFGEAEKNEESTGIDKTKDGGYIVTGYRTGTDKNTWLLKLNAQLTLIWSKDLGVAGDDTGVKVLQTSDGGMVIGANVGTGSNSRSKVIKLNKKGEF